MGRNPDHEKKDVMTNQEKAKLIAPWVNPAERITVDFKDVTGLNAEVFRVYGKRGVFIISRSLPTYERTNHHSVESGAGWRGSWTLYTGPRCTSSMALAFAGESKSPGRIISTCKPRLIRLSRRYSFISAYFCKKQECVE